MSENASQAAVDALAAQETAEQTTLAGEAASLTDLNTEVEALVAQNAAAGSPLDLSKLQALVTANVAAASTNASSAASIDAEAAPGAVGSTVTGPVSVITGPGSTGPVGTPVTDTTPDATVPPTDNSVIQQSPTPVLPTDAAATPSAQAVSEPTDAPTQ